MKIDEAIKQHQVSREVCGNCVEWLRVAHENHGRCAHLNKNVMTHREATCRITPVSFKRGKARSS